MQSPENRLVGASPEGTSLPQLKPLQAALEEAQNQWVEQELLFTGYLCARPFDKTLFYKYVSTGINIFVSCQAPFYS